MNASDMLDYTLGQLEGDAAEEASREVEADPVLADKIERLGRSLELLLDDDEDDYAPPPDLVRHTLSFVRAAQDRPAVLEFGPPRRRFRLGDFAMAATIFLASLLALAPAILRGRERWGRAACSNNLQKVGVRLHQYAAIHHAYPFVGADEEVPHVGAIVCRLNEAGFSIDPKDLQCPSCPDSDDKPGRVPRLDEIARTMKVSPGEACRMLDNDYAFHIGSYPSPDNGRDAPGPLRPDAGHQSIPILADRPGFDPSGAIHDGNSPNHGGRGQNVLFADGHAAWLSSRRVSAADSDLYLNNARRPAYGLGPQDSVLMPASLRVNPR